jgi:U4/U6 small nuclear ribonucleoprotein PRP4
MNAHGQRSQSVSWYHAPTSPRYPSPLSLFSILFSFFSPFSTLNLASCGADDKVQLWSLESDKPIKTLAGHVGRVNNVVFHPHYNWIASTSFDKTWCLWDLETGIKSPTEGINSPLPSSPVSIVLISPLGKELINQGGNSKAVYGLAFHCDGALVATAGLDATCRLWDLRSGRAIWNLR